MEKPYLNVSTMSQKWYIGKSTSELLLTCKYTNLELVEEYS